jgi:hypothetical protein
MCGCGNFYQPSIREPDRLFPDVSGRADERVALDELRAATTRMVLAVVVRQLRAVPAAAARGWSRLSRPIGLPER